MACALIALLSTAAHAQDWPARTVRIVVPFAAGGVGDLTARIVAQKLADSRVNAVIANATTPYDAKLFARMPALKVVARVGIGFDNGKTRQAQDHVVGVRGRHTRKELLAVCADVRFAS